MEPPTVVVPLAPNDLAYGEEVEEVEAVVEAEEEVGEKGEVSIPFRDGG